MPSLAKFCGIIFIIFSTTKLVSCDVQSCYACAGPKSDCVANNRTDFLKMDCNTFLVEGVNLASRTLEPKFLEKFDSEVGARKDNSEVGCFTVTFIDPTENPSERAVKSCAPSEIQDVDICEYMEGLVSVLGGEKTSCHFCKKDDCNSAISFASINRIVVCLLFLVIYSNEL